MTKKAKDCLYARLAHSKPCQSVRLASSVLIGILSVYALSLSGLMLINSALLVHMFTHHQLLNDMIVGLGTPRDGVHRDCQHVTNDVLLDMMDMKATAIFWLDASMLRMNRRLVMSSG